MHPTRLGLMRITKVLVVTEIKIAARRQPFRSRVDSVIHYRPPVSLLGFQFIPLATTSTGAAATVVVAPSPSALGSVSYRTYYT